MPEASASYQEGVRAEPNLRQQGKIIRGLLTQNSDVISVDEVQLNPGERESYQYALARGLITQSDQQSLLRDIEPNFKRMPLAALFSTISSNRQIMGIIADLALHDFSRRGSLSPKDLQSFIDLFPDPIAFELPLQNLLAGIRNNNGQQKKEEYDRSVETFGQAVYGKRWEYYRQLMLLNEEATVWRNKPGAASSYEARNPLLARLVREKNQDSNASANQSSYGQEQGSNADARENQRLRGENQRLADEIQRLRHSSASKESGAKPDAKRGKTTIDSYKVLGVKPDASSDMITRQYRNMLLAFHPDKVLAALKAADVAQTDPVYTMLEEFALEQTKITQAAYDQLRQQGKV